MKPEFSSSDLMQALAIVNGTAAAGVPGGLAEAGKPEAVEAEDPKSRAAATAAISR